jgi:carbonic anhydrase
MMHVAPARHWQHSLQLLKDGNQRFQQQKMNHILQHNLHAMLQGQSPHAAIVSCSDSRVSPDIIFDCSLGDLFIIQNAGNVCDASVFGSIQYAVQSLEIPLIVVMGAEGTGMRRLTREHCDFLVHLPMQGSVSSLNVSVATGVCLFEAQRQRLAL